jgi:predicted phage terminase large subunit-like protein
MQIPDNLAFAARKLLHQNARADYGLFQSLVHPVVSPEEYVHAFHLEAIAWKLQQVAEGKIKRLLIAAPPRHFKSYQVSVALAPFILGRDPTRKIVCASYGSNLAEDFASQSRTIMRSPTYAAIFPKAQLASKTPPVDFLRTTAGGYRYATSIGGPLTGMGADVMILDDPLKAADAGSKAARDAAYEWLKTTGMTRFDVPGEGVIIVAMQRLHQDDVIGRLISEGGWVLLELPSEAITTVTFETGPGTSVTLEPGDVLFPERVGAKILAERKAELGEAAYSAQYLQRPTPPGGHLFKMSKFKRFEWKAQVHKSDYEALVLSMDTGVSTAPTCDFTAYTVWGVRGEDLYLLHAKHGRWAFAEQLKELRWWAGHCGCMIIERSHIGIALLEELEREGIKGYFGYTPKADKHVRAQYAADFARKGHMHLPSSPPWLGPFEQELASFPHATNDDFVDSFSQFVIVLTLNPPHWLALKAFKSPSVAKFTLLC